MPDRVYRCSDGHLYTAGFGRALAKSVHLGVGTHLQKCPVDGHLREAHVVDADELSEADLAEAAKHTFH